MAMHLINKRFVELKKAVVVTWSIFVCEWPEPMASTWQGFTAEDQAKIKFGNGNNSSSTSFSVSLNNSSKSVHHFFSELVESNSVHIHSNEAFNLANKKRVEKKPSKKSSTLYVEERSVVVNDLPSEAMFTHKPKVATLLLLPQTTQRPLHFNFNTCRPKEMNLLLMSSLR